MTTVPPHPARRSRTALFGTLGAVAVLLAIGIIPRVERHRALAAEVRAADDTLVAATVSTASLSKPAPLVLPGTLQPLHEAVVYARAAGYVQRWFADIGTHVGAGQTLATIEAPEVDQEVQQARAQLSQAQATLALAKNDLERWQSLARDSAVSRQELDQKTAAYQSSAATASAARANLDRLTSVQGYSRVVAPFAGVVTARNVDVGTLVNPGTGGASTGTGTGGQGLFRVAETDTMRVYVDVPQSLAPSVRVGSSAAVSVPELHGRSFDGRVVRTADALDPNTRTLLVEVDVPNPDRALLAGSSAQVQLGTATQQAVVVPANALLVNTAGTQVVVVDAQHVAHYHRVDVGRDYGATVEILSGVSPGDTVVLNPGDDVRDGHRIKPVQSAAPK
jgi:RND family efflux transporter MFP subunit